MRKIVFHPDSVTNLVWESMLFAMLFYLMVEIPLRIALFQIVQVGSRIYWLDLIFDFIFFADTLKRFRTGYFSDTFLTEVIIEPSRIRLNYIKTWFFIDITSCLPITLLILRFQTISWIRYISLLKLLKLLRFARIGMTIKQVERKLRMTVGPFPKQMLMLFLVIMFSSHLVACLWLFSSNLTYDELLNYKNGTGDNWIDNELGSQENITLGNIYLMSFYWATSTLTSVGYGDIVAVTSKERLIASIACFLGSFLTGFIISSTTAAYGRAFKTTNAFREQMDKIKAYLSYRQVPPRLAKRIISYFEYYITRHALFDEQAILQTLSVPLRVELTSYLFEDVLKVIPLFKEINDSSFLSNVMMLLKPLSAAPGDILYHQNDIALELYFVVKGCLIGTKKSKPSFKRELLIGHHFGEKAVFRKESTEVARRTMTVKAETYCDLFSLAKKDFDDVVEDFPEVRQKLRTQSQKQNYQFNKTEISASHTSLHRASGLQEIDGKLLIDIEEYNRLKKQITDSEAKIAKVNIALRDAMDKFKRYIQANVHTPAAKALLEKYPLNT